MLENIRKNPIPWLLALLLIGGVFFHHFQTGKLHQQISALLAETEKNRTQVASLNERVPELRAEIIGLKETLKKLDDDTRSLRDQIDKKGLAEDTGDEIAELLHAYNAKEKAQAIESRIAETNAGVAGLENKFNNFGQQVSTLHSQQPQTRAGATPRPSQSLIPSPKQESIPAGASAICRDGTYSFSQNRRGTCSHHGGVARWLY